MSDLTDRDFLDLPRDRSIVADPGVVVTFGYGETYLIHRSDLPTLLDIAARSRRVRFPDVPKSYEHPRELHDEPRRFVQNVELAVVAKPGTAKRKLEEQAAKDAAEFGETLPQAAE